MNFSKALFDFEEELALQNSLHLIGETVLKHAISFTGGDGGLFLYHPPGSKVFDLVAQVGHSKNSLEFWKKCNLEEALPLPLAIRKGTSRFIEVKKDPKIKSSESEFLAVLPLGDAHFCSAGFEISFPAEKNLSDEGKEFLKTIARLTESAFEKLSGEGV